MPAYLIVEHNRWYSSPEYRPLIALRKECTSELDMMFTLEGA